MKKLLCFLLSAMLCFFSLSINIRATEISPDRQSGETADAQIRETEQAGTTEQTGPTEQTDAPAAVLDVSAPSAILMEASTGSVIYEKNPDEALRLASITKIMTLLLTFEALEQGKIHLEDEVITSAYAQSMGGSQVFLEAGEIQTVDTLIKCIAVASGNDAAVAIAEYIAGSEEAFVGLMNERAYELQMISTHFEDCCGLTDSATHVTSARDVAIMSRELITKYPAIYEYTKIWMEDIVHTTSRGSSVFTLTSTNKLLRQYPYSTGLKTGSTSSAKYCYSGTASKDGIDLIAVVMAAPDHKVRFQDAVKMFQYGFSVSKLYTDEKLNDLPEAEVKGGIEKTVDLRYETQFSYLDIQGSDFDRIHKEVKLHDEHNAPIEEGSVAGEAVYFLGDQKIGSVNILYNSNVKEAKYRDYLKQVWKIYF